MKHYTHFFCLTLLLISICTAKAGTSGLLPGESPTPLIQKNTSTIEPHVNYALPKKTTCYPNRNITNNKNIINQNTIQPSLVLTLTDLKELLIPEELSHNKKEWLIDKLISFETRLSNAVDLKIQAITQKQNTLIHQYEESHKQINWLGMGLAIYAAVITLLTVIFSVQFYFKSKNLLEQAKDDARKTIEEFKQGLAADKKEVTACKDETISTLQQMRNISNHEEEEIQKETTKKLTHSLPKETSIPLVDTEIEDFHNKKESLLAKKAFKAYENKNFAIAFNLGKKLLRQTKLRTHLRFVISTIHKLIKLDEPAKNNREKISLLREATTIYSKYEKILTAKDYSVWANMCHQLVELGEQSFASCLVEKLLKAIELDPNSLHYRRRLAAMYCYLASKHKDDATIERAYLDKGLPIYNMLLLAFPDDAQIMGQLGVINLKLCQLTSFPACESHLHTAFTSLEKAKDLSNDCAAFNLACLYSLVGDSENCKNALEIYMSSDEEDKLQSLTEDEDFKNMRNKKWFKKFVEQAKQEQTDSELDNE